MSVKNQRNIPTEWQSTVLDYAGKYLGGGTPSTSRKDFWGGQIHWVTSKSLGSSLCINKGERFISEDAVKYSSTNIIPRGNLLVGTRVGVGKVAVTQVDIAISQDLTGLIVDENFFVSFFLAYQLLSERVQNLFQQSKRGVTIQGVTRDEIKQFPIVCPPLPEQKKIAAVLSKLQKAIEIQDNILGSLRDLKKSMMHRLFSYGLKGEKRKKTEIGLLPEGWEVTTISSGILPTKQRKPMDIETIKYIDVSSVSNLKYEVVSHADFLGNEAPGRARKIIHTGDIIIATVRPTLRRIAVIHEEFHQQFCSTAFCVLRCKSEDLNNMYLFYALQRETVHTVLETIQRGANYPAVTDSQIKGMLIPVPPLPEQNEIAHILQTIDHKIEVHEGKKSSYQDLFKTMLNNLMTGTIRVNELDIDTAEVEAA